MASEDSIGSTAAEATRIESFEIIDFPMLKVLVSGRSGSSKSVIANGLFGRLIVTERHGIVTESREDSLQHYKAIVDKHTLHVWISSSLQDGSNEADDLKELKEKCSDVDLIIYCIKMTETRFIPGNPDAIAITKITQTLGVNCWEKAVFVLTYANVAASINYEPEELTSDESRTTFQESIKMWKKVLQDTLSKEAGIPQKSLDIKVVPAGHYKQLHLPDREYWLSVLWSECINVIPSEEVKKVMVVMNKSRFKDPKSVVDQDFSDKDIHEQPIILVVPPTSFFYRLFLAIWDLAADALGKFAGQGNS